jgi:hypothetical protein
MKQAPPVLLPILRSGFQGEVLAWLFLHPERGFSLSEPRIRRTALKAARISPTPALWSL